jgi:hypothetical protein
MGPWSLYQKQQQTLLSFIRPLLFCSESHLSEKSLLIEIGLKKHKHKARRYAARPATNSDQPTFTRRFDSRLSSRFSLARGTDVRQTPAMTKL